MDASATGVYLNRLSVSHMISDCGKNRFQPVLSRQFAHATTNISSIWKQFFNETVYGKLIILECFLIEIVSGADIR